MNIKLYHQAPFRFINCDVIINDKKVDILAKDDSDKFLHYEAVPSKVILFNDNMETSNVFKALTAQYRDRFDFAEIRNTRSKKELIDFYSIKKFPTLMLLDFNHRTQKFD